MSYLFVIVVTLILGMGTQAYIKSTYAKYSKISNGCNITGAQAARKMLNDNGLTDVAIREVSGSLTDHYDPRNRTVNLSQGVYGSASVAAVAVACHECGHAVQHATNYAPMQVRSALIPAVNIASNAWVFILIIGFVLNWFGLVFLACIVYAIVVLFQFVTLPVEFNASRRGLAYISSGGFGAMANNPGVYNGQKSVLRAAALTYVAAALSSLLTLLYYLSRAQRN